MRRKEELYKQKLYESIDEAIRYVIKENTPTLPPAETKPFKFNDEYTFDNGEFSLDQTNAMAPDKGSFATLDDNYTIVQRGKLFGGWQTVTAANGLMAWVNTKEKQHKAIQDLGWFDYCSDFTGTGRTSGNGGIFNKKNKMERATGVKDNIHYTVYSDGRTYERDTNRYTEYTQDEYGNVRQGPNRFNNGEINSDGTETTSYILSHPDSYSPEKLIRVAFNSKQNLMKFYHIWNYSLGNNYNSVRQTPTNIRIGTQDNDSENYFFLDIPNGNGVYEKIQTLLDGLENGNISYNTMSKQDYFDRYEPIPYQQNNNNINESKLNEDFGRIVFGSNVDTVKDENEKASRYENQQELEFIIAMFEDNYGGYMGYMFNLQNDGVYYNSSNHADPFHADTNCGTWSLNGNTITFRTPSNNFYNIDISDIETQGLTDVFTTQFIKPVIKMETSKLGTTTNTQVGKMQLQYFKFPNPNFNYSQQPTPPPNGLA